MDDCSGNCTQDADGLAGSVGPAGDSDCGGLSDNRVSEEDVVAEPDLRPRFSPDWDEDWGDFQKLVAACYMYHWSSRRRSYYLSNGYDKDDVTQEAARGLLMFAPKQQTAISTAVYNSSHWSMSRISHKFCWHTTRLQARPLGDDYDRLSTGNSPDLDVEYADMREAIIATLNKEMGALGSRQQDILRMRVGMDPWTREHTLEEVSKVFKITRERIRQIQAAALKKLANNPTIQALIELYGRQRTAPLREDADENSPTINRATRATRKTLRVNKIGSKRPRKSRKQSAEVQSGHATLETPAADGCN